MNVFDESILNKIKDFIVKADSILLLSHLDADGISSASLMSIALEELDKKFNLRILKQLEKKEEFDNLNDLIIITDMGSGQFNLIKEYCDNKKFIIIDHHQSQNKFEHENIIHFNPELNDDSYSGSTLSYIVSSFLTKKAEKFIHLALVGATGDMQHKNGFKGLNLEILNKGKEMGYLKINKGLNLFGRESRPLFQTLAYSTDIIIPDVSGSETKAINFLNSINIPLKNGEEFITLGQLNEEQSKKLVSEIILKRIRDKLDSNIISDIISISNFDGVLSDLNEWSVMFNACGRQDKSSLAVLLGMGHTEYAMPLIKQVIDEYKKLLMNSMNLVKNDESVRNIVNDTLIINAQDKIKDTIIGTVGGMVLNSNEFNVNTVLGLAHRDEEFVKVSCRTNNDINIGMILKEVCENLGCVGGGHKCAGGALVTKNKLNEFIEGFNSKISLNLNSVENGNI